MAACGLGLALLCGTPAASPGRADEPRDGARATRPATVAAEAFPLEPAPGQPPPPPPAQADLPPLPPTGQLSRPQPRPPAQAAPPGPSKRASRPRGDRPGATQAGPVEAQPRPEASDAPLDIAALRAETRERIKAIDAPPAAEGHAAEAASPPPVPRDLLLERQARLDEHEKAEATLRELTHPEASPEQLAELARDELRRAREKAAAEPALPAAFRDAAAGTTDAARAEMSRAIEAAKAELKDAQAGLESARVEASKAGPAQQALRGERDSLFQQVAALRAAAQDRSSAVASAASPDARRLARERLTNDRLKAAVAEVRLKIAEARLDRERKLAEVRELNLHVQEARAAASRRVVDRMQARYRTLAESQQRDLKREAETQEARAHQSGDLLDRYRAGRLSELLELEARVVRNEQALADGTKPDFDEQKALADRALDDFEEIKRLLDDHNVSRLDALRLTNDFRRIGPERERLLRNELAQIEAQLQFYENGLSNVELELIEDAEADQAERDALLERLEPSRHPSAREAFAALDLRRRDLLLRRRVALTGLVGRASQTLEQVLRRRRVLEDEYGFIRTHIFWVRDQEPVGPTVVSQAGREVRRLSAGLLHLAEEAGDRKLWGTPSTEFLCATVAALILPLGLFRLRRLLRRRVAHALPPSHLHGDGHGHAAGPAAPAATTIRPQGPGYFTASTTDAGR
ncbi:coiled-coil domain-containing protein [Aquisphaera giovannonii]|nr:hypothetical protein [Aquisphaera giovannonii]